jgi:hypothetical protein
MTTASNGSKQAPRHPASIGFVVMNRKNTTMLRYCLTIAVAASVLTFGWHIDSASAQTPAPKASSQKKSGTNISFNEESKTFANVKAGTVATHVFSFKNSGTEPLAIQSVSTTCGCVTANWTKTPMKPGETGSVTVTLNTQGKAGALAYTLSVVSNAGSKTLSINANVVAAAPAAQKK